jgi:hypothetical protein
VLETTPEFGKLDDCGNQAKAHNGYEWNLKKSLFEVPGSIT